MTQGEVRRASVKIYRREERTIASKQTQALLGMACDRSRTPWRTPSLSKECDRLHALSVQMWIVIFYFSATISQSGSPKSKILNDLIVIIKFFTKDNPAGCNRLKSYFFDLLVRDTIRESLSDFLLKKSQIPVEALWSLRSIDLRVIALHPSCVNSRMPQNASLVPWSSEPISVNVFSFVIRKRGNSQYPQQLLFLLEGPYFLSWYFNLLYFQIPIHFYKKLRTWASAENHQILSP